MLQINALYHAFGEKKVLNNINLSIEPGEIVAVVGPSGCGKSTLFSNISGKRFRARDEIITGEVFVDGTKVAGPNRNVGVVYQTYELYEFLTARKNVAKGLALDQTSTLFRWFRPFAWRKLRAKHLAEADVYLEKVRLPNVGDLYPANLSGGMKQRVAIAQSLIMRPKILLMDEPFGALDEATREELQMLLWEFNAANVAARAAGTIPPFTVIIVTHELNEAMFVSNRVVGLSQYHADGKNGATIVYDKPSPIFLPHNVKDAEAMATQREEIRAILDENNCEPAGLHIKPRAGYYDHQLLSRTQK